MRVQQVMTQLGPGRGCRSQPAVELGPGDLKLPAHPIDREGGLLRADKDEVVAHRCLVVKKALLFGIGVRDCNRN